MVCLRNGGGGGVVRSLVNVSSYVCDEKSVSSVKIFVHICRVLVGKRRSTIFKFSFKNDLHESLLFGKTC